MITIKKKKKTDSIKNINIINREKKKTNLFDLSNWYLFFNYNYCEDNDHLFNNILNIINNIFYFYEKVIL